MRNVALNHQPVELFKLIKFEGLANSGGEAKKIIEEGLVSVNGEIETRKRKKIVAGDIISIGDENFTTVLTTKSTSKPKD